MPLKFSGWKIAAAPKPYLGWLWRYVYQRIVATAKTNLVTGVDAGNFALAVERRGGGLELGIARMVGFHHLGSGARDTFGFLSLIYTRHINSYRVRTGEYAKMRDDRHVGVVGAVTAR